MTFKGYPVFLVGLENRRCVVIGGTHEGERKVAGLLESQAQVVVISEEVTDEIRQWAEAGTIQWIKRSYQPGDLQDAYLVIAERRDAETNTQIWDEAGHRALVNVMDDLEHCNFIAGSILKRGPLTIAISTNGVAPALAVRLRERFEREIGPEYGEMLTLLQELREPLAAHYPKFSERRDIWYRLVDSDILDLIRADKVEVAIQRIAEIAGAEVIKTLDQASS